MEKRGQLSFWPGVALVAAGIPALFFLRFGRVDALGYGLTGFLLLLTFAVEYVPRLNDRYGAEQAAIAVAPGRMDWLGPVWLLCVPFAPALAWLIAQLSVLTPGNWRWVLGAQVGLCVVLPCVSVLPLLRYVRGQAAPYALLILAIGTGFPASFAAWALADLWQGPRVEAATVTAVDRMVQQVGHREVQTDILELTLADGRTLTANATVLTPAVGPATLVVLEALGVVIAVNSPG